MSSGSHNSRAVIRKTLCSALKRYFSTKIDRTENVESDEALMKAI